MDIFITVIGIMVVGYILTDLILAKEEMHWGIKISLGWCLGLGVLSQQLLLYSFLSVPWIPVLVILPWVAVMIFYIRFRGTKIHNLLSRYEVGVVTLFGIIGSFLAYYMLALPVWDRDGWLIWDFKARVFAQSGRISLEFLQAEHLQWSHMNYPLLLPLVQSWFYTVSGELSTTAPKIIYPIIFVCILLTIYSTLRATYNRKHTPVLMALIAGSIPVVIKNSQLNFADLPLSLFTLVALSLGYLYLRNQSVRYLLLCQIVLGLGAWTKNEGIVIWAVTTVLLWIWGVERVGEKIRIKDFLITILGSIVIWLPWFIFAHYYRLGFEDWTKNLSWKFILEGGDRLNLVTSTFLTEMSKSLYGYIYWLVFGVSFLLIVGLLARGKKDNGLLLFPFAAVIVGIISYMGIYFFTPQPLGWHLVTSLEGLLLHFVPSAVLAIGLVVCHYIAKRKQIK